MQYTKEQISSYVLGWLSAGKDTHDFNDVFAAIKNAARMVDDDQDGIEAYVKRFNHSYHIEFEWEEFKEDDNTWDALFVRVDGGKWMLASSKFGTEDQEKIKLIINGSRN